MDKSGLKKQKSVKDRAVHIEDLRKPQLDDVYFLHGRELFDWNNKLRDIETDLRTKGLTLKRVLKNEPQIYYKVSKNGSIEEEYKKTLGRLK